MSGSYGGRRSLLWGRHNHRPTRIVGLLTAALVAVSIGLFANSSANPSHASEDWTRCLVVRNAEANISFVSAQYRVSVTNGCSTNPRKWVQYYMDWGRPGQSGFPVNSEGQFYFPSPGSIDQVDIPLPDLPPGTYSPRIKFKTYGPNSETVVTLPRLTIKAPQQPSFPNGSEVTRPQEPSAVETCLYVDGEYYGCWEGFTWTYDECWDDAQYQSLRKRQSGAWRTVARDFAKRSPSACSKKYPWRVSVTRSEPREGSFRYRLYFPPQGGDKALTVELLVEVR